jgi:hypothetical protein
MLIMCCVVFAAVADRQGQQAGGLHHAYPRQARRHRAARPQGTRASNPRSPQSSTPLGLFYIAGPALMFIAA